MRIFATALFIAVYVSVFSAQAQDIDQMHRIGERMHQQMIAEKKQYVEDQKKHVHKMLNVLINDCFVHTKAYVHSGFGLLDKNSGRLVWACYRVTYLTSLRHDKLNKGDE